MHRSFKSVTMHRAKENRARISRGDSGKKPVLASADETQSRRA
jgi:hypothetical protein